MFYMYIYIENIQLLFSFEWSQSTWIKFTIQWIKLLKKKKGNVKWIFLLINSFNVFWIKVSVLKFI